MDPDNQDSQDQELLQDAAARAVRYYTDVAHREVAPRPAAVDALAAFDVALPELGRPAAEVLAQMDELGSPATVATAGRRFFGFVVGGSLPAALSAHWLATAWDQNACMSVLAPSTTKLETVAGRWLIELFGLPEEMTVSFATGTTTADITALLAARRRVPSDVGWDERSQGLFGAPPVTVVVGADAHTTLHRALRVIGMGEAQLQVVPVDDQGRMRADALPELRPPCIVCLQAGNVNTGAFDPLRPIATAAKQAGAWVHVDGAFGMWAAASPTYRGLVDGIELADSWATDGHKWLNVPYDSGIAFVRDQRALLDALQMHADYLIHGPADPFNVTLEASRRGRGVDIWAALANLGRSGVRDLVDRCCRHASRFAEGCREAGFEVLNDVVLNQVLVAFGDDQRTLDVLDWLAREGTTWCTGTRWHGREAMRISVSSWRTTEADVERSLAAMVRAAEAVAGC